MIIRDFTLSINDGIRTSSATVIWEDNNYSDHELFFEIRDQWIGNQVIDEPLTDTFLVSCFPLAAIHGETRLQIEGRPCPMLAEGLRTAHAWWQSWGGMPRPPPVIEILPRGRSQTITGSRRAFSF